MVCTANAHLYAPQTIVHLQYSAPMQMALALSGLGNGFAAHFDFLEGRLDLTPVQAVAQKIALHVTPELDERYRGKFVADLTVSYADGTSEDVFVEDPIGTAHNPMPRTDQDWKFGELTAPVLGKAGSATLLAALDRLDPAMAARDLAALTAADEG